MKAKIMQALAYSTVFYIFVMVGFSNCSRLNFKNNAQESFILKSGNTSTIGNPLTLASEKLLTTMCATFNRCYPSISPDTCRSQLINMTGFANKLGLASSLDTIESVIAAESKGEIQKNISGAESCSEGIEALSCQDPRVIAGYDNAKNVLSPQAQQLAAIGTCKEAYSKPQLSLEVPIELSDKGMASLTMSQTFARTRTSFNANDFDGSIAPYFEIVAKNSDNLSRTVWLVDASDVVVGSIIVPAKTSDWKLLRSSFTGDLITSNYRVRLEGTTTQGNLLVSTSRIILQQVNATKTKIYIPLIGGYAGDTSSFDNSSAEVDKINFLSYAQNNVHYYSIWKKQISAFDRLDSAAPWTLEVVMAAGSNSGSVAGATLYNLSLDQPVVESEISSSATTPVLLQQSFSDSATNFADLNQYELRLKRGVAGSDGSIFKAGLWVKLTELKHTDIYYRISTTNWMNTSNGLIQIAGRALFSRDLFSQSLTSAFEQTGYVSASNTPCIGRLSDAGDNDASSNGVLVAGSSLNFPGVNKTTQRTGNLNLNSNHRFIVDIDRNLTAGSCITPSSSIVLSF